MSNDDPGLLQTLDEAITTRGQWRGWTVRRPIPDAHGYHYALALKHATAGGLVAVCKSSRYEGDVSVMQEAVETAARVGDRVAVFVFEDVPRLGRAYAFEPSTVEATGRPIEIRSKKGLLTDAWQIDPDEFGAVLGSVVSGHAEPPVVRKQARLNKIGREEA